MVPELAIQKEEPVEIHIHKLATGVRDTQTEMVRVYLELNLQIIELHLSAQPPSPPEVKEHRVNAITEIVTVVESAVTDYT